MIIANHSQSVVLVHRGCTRLLGDSHMSADLLGARNFSFRGVVHYVGQLPPRGKTVEVSERGHIRSRDSYISLHVHSALA